MRVAALNHESEKVCAWMGKDGAAGNQHAHLPGTYVKLIKIYEGEPDHLVQSIFTSQILH